MFGIFKSKKRFISEQQHKDNLDYQLSMSPQTVAQLREHGVTENKLLKLEYFFYTNASVKAKSLSEELSSLGYSSEFGESANDDNIKVITGWTSPISMSTEAVMKWTSKMCHLGYSHDCEFDGWGTNPEQ
ncbi:ribonuclease E inhibitor RraB [Shewanella nanhaiensis]|uniref:Ribonuclease E inhibitor RraB n=1 Tax=Shewanella nanhaiensis TaxID=2864872 RepID=A0ABS7E1G9_9GAMM|nr:ribonuclease E inhibitor RraB [Shewanella nanhaiensis]MBW8183483.1 ribonuclease E inhibitor RraB [Shewanella nanhaiensis]